MFIMRKDQVRAVIRVECENKVVWKPEGFLGELFVTAHMLITMIYLTQYYVSFFTIPYRCNQIKKTQKELEKEQILKNKKIASLENV